MKMHGGKGGTSAYILNLGSRCRWLSFTHLGRPHSRSGHRGEEKYHLALSRIESLFLRRAACRCTDWTIRARTVSCVGQNKRSILPFVYRPIITSTHSCSLLHVSFQNKPPLPTIASNTGLRAFVGLCAFLMWHMWQLCRVEKVSCLVRGCFYHHYTIEGVGHYCWGRKFWLPTLCVR